MRDGMPGPGWWIASDGRWYPPSLHPNMRAWARGQSSDEIPDPPIAAAAPAAAATLVADHPTSTFDAHHEVTNEVTNGAAPVLAPERLVNGTSVAPPAALVAPVAVPARVPETIAADTDAARVAARTAEKRFRLALGLGVGTLLVIVYLAGGRDSRPSLDTDVNTTVGSGVALPAPSSSTATSAQRAAASTTTPAVAPTAPSSTPSSAATASTTAPRSTTAPSTTVAKVTPHVVSVFDLVKGNCLDGAGLTDGLVTTIRVVDCSEVHTHEVYYSGRYPESTFDATKISNYANDTCLTQFAPYVGIDYARSRYQYLHIVPTQESWTKDNDRDVVCVAFDEDGTITGSIAGRAQ